MTSYEIEKTETTNAANIAAEVLAALPEGAVIVLYADGAALPTNPGPAAGAFAIVHEGKVIHSAAHFLGHGTNNIAEMTAALDGLRFLTDRREDLKITVVSDSEYLIKGMNERLAKWKAKGWRTASGTPAKNRALWEELDALASTFPALGWKWVKGHAGNEFNELVDGLANAAAEAGAETDDA